jgi:hypothetical protein
MDHVLVAVEKEWSYSEEPGLEVVAAIFRESFTIVDGRHVK